VAENDDGQRLVSLAAGTVLDIGPAETVAVAARAGFDGVGLWFDPDTWTDATTREVDKQLDGTGLTPLDMEPVILGRDVDPGDVLVDIAGELGVRNVLVAGGAASHAAVVERFGQLCDRAAPAGVTVVLEFLPIFTIATLHDAVAVVQEANRPNGGVLIDTLHLARSGGTVEDIATVPLSLLPYLQLADATARLDDPSPANLREEALHGRLLPGEGALPLAATLYAVPSVPISVELRSRPLMERYPDPTERAQAVLTATRAVLA
jgi:sugar phosphate isomerase/epimerase